LYIGTLDPASNKATFRRAYEIVDDETDEAIDLTDATIVYEIRDQKSGSTLLSATNGDGITLGETGVYEVLFSRDDMTTLEPITHDVGVTVLRGDEEQFIIGTIAILDGVVQT
jgi:hypothetical protein